MDAIILAAGRGTRLRPITDTMPKPLVPVAGRGTLLRTLDILPASVDRIILVVGYLQEQIREAVSTTWNGIPVTYITQSHLDGTGGALRLAQSHLTSDRFLVLNGDDLYDAADLERLVASDRGVLVSRRTVTKPMDTWRVRDGVLHGTETGVIGAEASINIGAYLLGHEWYTTTPTLVPGKTTEYSLPHALPQLFFTHTYHAVDAAFWYPCGTPEEILIAEAALRHRGE